MEHSQEHSLASQPKIETETCSVSSSFHLAGGVVREVRDEGRVVRWLGAQAAAGVELGLAVQVRGDGLRWRGPGGEASGRLVSISQFMSSSGRKASALLRKSGEVRGASAGGARGIPVRLVSRDLPVCISALVVRVAPHFVSPPWRPSHAFMCFFKSQGKLGTG